MRARLVASVSAALAAHSCAWAGDKAFDSPVPLPSLTTTLSPARTRMRVTYAAQQRRFAWVFYTPSPPGG